MFDQKTQPNTKRASFDNVLREALTSLATPEMPNDLAEMVAKKLRVRRQEAAVTALMLTLLVVSGLVLAFPALVALASQFESFLSKAWTQALLLALLAPLLLDAKAWLKTHRTD
jgi:hypothetical protein